MIPKEIIKKIRHIQIVTSHMVNEVFAGQYESAFKGKGIEFAEVREYQVGDDVRTIDWNVTARTGVPHIKTFAEERELSVMILLDVSASSLFGTNKQLKSELAAELCSLLAFAAIKNNDKVGVVIFSDRIEKFIPPKKGISHVSRIIREALYFKPAGKKTDIAQALEYLNKVTTRRSIVFVISDFFSADFRKALSITNKKHDCIAVKVTDPREEKLVDVGIIGLSDAENGGYLCLDTSSRPVREAYAQQAMKRNEDLEKTFASVSVDMIDITAGESYAEPLACFFRRRGSRHH